MATPRSFLFYRELPILAEPRTTESIMCACPGAWRTSVITPNSDVETNSKYDYSKRREPTQKRSLEKCFKLLRCN